MTDSLLVHISITQLCEETELPRETVMEFVELGIIEPYGQSPQDWVFEAAVVPYARRAYRLHRDLGMDWHGVALALELLEQRDQLRAENERLRRRLSRFLLEP